VEYLETKLDLPPLQVIAAAIAQTSDRARIGGLILGTYDRFLAILDDPEKRKHLKELGPEAFAEDTLFKDVRVMSHTFQDGLVQLFFKSNDALAELTMKYGVF